MREIAASKFKAQCLGLLEKIDTDGIIITKHGRPIAKLTAYRDAPADLIGSLAGQIEIKGNLFSTGVKWDAES